MVALSVVLPVYDPPLQMLATAIESILTQTFRDFEFLILDDGSMDQQTRFYLDLTASGDTRVRVFHEPHRGLTPTLNRGLALARGEFIARQDADDWSEPQRFSHQIEYLVVHREVALAGTDTQLHRADGKPLWRARLPHAAAEVSRAFQKGNPLVHGSTMYRRALALEIGGYREAFSCSQDYDFFWRMTEQASAVNLEKVLYHYRYSAGAVSAQRAVEQAGSRACGPDPRRSAAKGRAGGHPRGARSGGCRDFRGFQSNAQASRPFDAGRRFLGRAKSVFALLAVAPRNSVGVGETFSPGSICGRPSGAGGVLPMRVLFVIPGDGQGSSMIFVRRESETLAREGVEVHLFYLGSRTSPRALWGELRRFRKELVRLRPAVVHAHFGTVTALFAALACGFLPLVVTFRGGDLNPAPPSYRWPAKARAACGCLFSQLAALRAQRIICVSRELGGRLWWRRGAVLILPTGVDENVFRPWSRTLARQRLGWEERERVVLFNAGHDVLVKRLDLARAAVEKARLGIPSLRLEILDGSVPPSLLPEMMNAADCLLLTSVSEGSPTVVQEALACDLPVVTVQVGDVVERLRGVRDSTVASADASVLGHALARIVDPPRRSNGSLKVAEFSARPIARRIKAIYRELAEA